MLTVDINELQASLLNYLLQASSGEQITVTSNGKALATISSPTDKKAAARQRLEEIAATAIIHDVISPLDCL